jgi:hypothetical protein
MPQVDSGNNERGPLVSFILRIVIAVGDSLVDSC